MMGTVRYEDITVSDLCTQAGFSRKAFYRYFSGKEGALYALIDHTLWELDSFPFTENTGRNASREKMVWFFQFWKNQKPLLDALDFSGISELLMKRMLVYAMSGPSVIRHFLTYRNSNLAAEEYAMTFGVCGLASIAFEWHRRGYQQSPEEIGEIALELLTKPLLQIQKSHNTGS
jgi:AcrR family transcriptional regulator